MSELTLYEFAYARVKVSGKKVLRIVKFAIFGFLTSLSTGESFEKPDLRYHFSSILQSNVDIEIPPSHIIWRIYMPKMQTGYVCEDKSGTWYARFDYRDNLDKRRTIRRKAAHKTKAKELLDQPLQEYKERVVSNTL